MTWRKEENHVLSQPTWEEKKENLCVQKTESSCICGKDTASFAKMRPVPKLPPTYSMEIALATCMGVCCLNPPPHRFAVLKGNHKETTLFGSPLKQKTDPHAIQLEKKHTPKCIMSIQGALSKVISTSRALRAVLSLSLSLSRLEFPGNACTWSPLRTFLNDRQLGLDFCLGTLRWTSSSYMGGCVSPTVFEAFPSK